MYESCPLEVLSSSPTPRKASRTSSSNPTPITSCSSGVVVDTMTGVLAPQDAKSEGCSSLCLTSFNQVVNAAAGGGIQGETMGCTIAWDVVLSLPTPLGPFSGTPCYTVQYQTPETATTTSGTSSAGRLSHFRPSGYQSSKRCLAQHIRAAQD